MGTIRLLAISGSLRALSLNSALLRVAARLAPAGVHVEIFPYLGKLPLFNPDLSIEATPVAADLRVRLIGADGVIIASPEYAHGVTGVIKNALDWMVGCEAFVNKPVAFFNASTRAVHAQASLREIVSTMSARIVDEAAVAVPILGSQLDEDGIVSNPEISAAIRGGLEAFRAAIVRYKWDDIP